MPEDTKTTAPPERDRSLHRHGDLDPSQWDEQKTVTGRPNDLPVEQRDPTGPPTYANSTFADRKPKPARKANVDEKKVDPAATKNKAVSAATTKRG